jgi:hypothetical protein
VNRDLLRFGTRPEDPGSCWADELLAPLRRRSDAGDLGAFDVTASVMRRIASAKPAPMPVALPARWAAASWAATIALGMAALGLLLTTAGIMAFGSDQGARDLWALTVTSARLVAHGYGHLGLAAAGLAQAGLALFHGAWALVETAAPLVRAAGFLAAVAGILSIVVSIYVVSRARVNAPVAGGRGPFRMNGGLS